jgi:hypothetical protein
VCHVQATIRLRRLWQINELTDAVALDLQARLQLGIQRYGQPLQPFNGRSFVRDQYEEILDAIAYGEGIIFESSIDAADYAFILEAQKSLIEHALCLRKILMLKEAA